jgi:signal transduction histidine kinase
VAPTVLVLLMSTSGLDDAHRAHGWWPLLGVLGQTLPLLLLRRSPGPVLLVVAGMTAAQLVAGLPVTNGMMGQAIATGAVVARTRWPTAPLVPVVVLATSLVSAWLGGQPGLLRFVSVTALALLVAWVLGDAAGRRTQVRRAMEEELSRRRDRPRLRAQVVALEERLRNTRELHDLVGKALDAIVLQVAAARAHRGRLEAARRLRAIEELGRQVLAELDGFLRYLRQPDVQGHRAAGPGTTPVAVPEGRRLPIASRLPSTGSVLGVAFLTFVDESSVPTRDWPFEAWPVVSTAVVALPLLLRHRAPQAVLTFLVTVLTGLALAGMPIGSGGLLAIGIALHEIAARRARHRALVAAVATCLVTLTVAVLVYPREAGAFAGPLLALVAGALYVGDTARVAREHNESLARRLAEAEEEEDLRARAAVADERTRMARDLHDSIGHALSLIVVQAGAARLAAASLRDASDRQVEEALRSIETLAREALGELDAVVQSLRGDAAGDVPVLPGPADLDDVVRAVRAAGTSVDVVAAPTGDLPRSLQVTILRIVQEALTNVVKHAPGARATVQVVRSDDSVSVTVHNDPGARPDRVLPSGGRGLAGMQERVSMFQGELSAGPDGRGGHRVEARIPVPRRPSSPHPLTQTAGDHR